MVASSSLSPQSSQKASRRYEEWRFRLFGPSLVHVQYEVYLLCSLMLLTIGSMTGLYKDSYGRYPGDYTFLLLIFLAASRHLFFRIWCTWDPSTHASPGITGLISHLLQSHVTGGQSFDRPPPMQQLHHHPASSDRSGSHAVSASSSTAVASPAAADRMVQITGGVLETKEVSSWSQLIPSSLVYAWQLPRQYLWFPLSRLVSRSLRPTSDDDDSINSNNGNRYTRGSDPPRIGWIRRKYQAIQHYTLHLWISYGPSLQFLLVAGVFANYAWQFCFYTTGKTPLSLIRGVDKSRYTSILSVNTQDDNAIRQAAEKDASHMIGDYDRHLKPPETEILMVLLGFGTLSSLLFFSRVMFPLPDLVAGGNVVRDIRTQTRAAAMTHHVSGAVGGSGVGSKKGGRNGWFSGIRVHVKDLFALLMLPASAIASDAAVWTERHNSIAAENRLHLALGIVIARVTENVFLVVVLPRSNFTCQATGHCPSGPPLWELSRILYPGGFSKAKRLDSVQIFGFMESDMPSLIWTLVGVVVVSIVLLLAQTVVLNRSYLSILAYHSFEWELVPIKSKESQQPAELPPSPASTTPQQLSTASVWEPKRKYLEGELVYYPDASGAMYRATSNSPEGHPNDRESHGLNERFRSELGHPATSELLGKLAAYQLVAAFLHFALWVVLLLCGHSTRTYGLIWAVAAHVVATHGVLSVVTSAAHNVASRKNRSQPSNAMRALQQLSAEIIGGH